MKDETEEVRFKFKFFPTSPEEWCWFRLEEVEGEEKLVERYSFAPPPRYKGFEENIWYTERDWGL